MDHTKPPCYIAEDLLENLEDEPDSQRRVKEALYPAFTKAQTISEDWLESVE